MATLSSVASNVTDMLRRSDLTAAAKTEIANAIRHYSRRASWVVERRGGNITTTAGQPWYSIIDNTAGAGIESSPSGTTPTATDGLTNLVKLEYAKIELGTIDWPLEIVDWRTFEDLAQETGTTSTPNVITHYIGRIGLWPNPTAGLTVYVSGFFKPIVPSTDSDESVWFDQYQELIENSVCQRLCMKWLQDTEAAAYWAPLVQQQESLLMAENVARQTTGRLKPECV